MAILSIWSGSWMRFSNPSRVGACETQPMCRIAVGPGYSILRNCHEDLKSIVRVGGCKTETMDGMWLG